MAKLLQCPRLISSSSFLISSFPFLISLFLLLVVPILMLLARVFILHKGNLQPAEQCSLHYTGISTGKHGSSGRPHHSSIITLEYPLGNLSVMADPGIITLAYPLASLPVMANLTLCNVCSDTGMVFTAT